MYESFSLCVLLLGGCQTIRVTPDAGQMYTLSLPQVFEQYHELSKTALFEETHVYDGKKLIDIGL